MHGTCYLLTGFYTVSAVTQSTEKKVLWLFTDLWATSYLFWPYKKLFTVEYCRLNCQKCYNPPQKGQYMKETGRFCLHPRNSWRIWESWHRCVYYWVTVYWKAVGDGNYNYGDPLNLRWPFTLFIPAGFWDKQLWADVYQLCQWNFAVLF